MHNDNTVKPRSKGPRGAKTLMHHRPKGREAGSPDY